MANGDDQGEMEPLSSESVLACVKRRRDRLLKEARNSGHLFGYGRVAHLVKAFERLLSIPSTKVLHSSTEDQNVMQHLPSSVEEAEEAKNNFPNAPPRSEMNI